MSTLWPFLVWGAAGLLFLFFVERFGCREPRRSISVGELLLFLIAGAPFLPLLLGSLFCQIELPLRLPRRTRPPNPPEVIAAEAEVNSWLRERRGRS